MLKPVGIIFSERRAPESRSPSSGIPHLVKPGIERGSNPYHFLVVRVEGDQLDRVIDLDIFPVSRSGARIADSGKVDRFNVMATLCARL